MALSRLLISFGASESWDIVGDDGEIAEQYRNIKEALEAPDDGTRQKFFEFVGMRNLADRVSETMLIRIENIKGVDLQEPK